MVFYFINKNEHLVTCTNTLDPRFKSNDKFFIGISWGIFIRNDRKELDDAILNRLYWNDMKYGVDAYPTKSDNDNYFIAGGNNSYF